MTSGESLGDALSHLVRDLGDLFRAELALFKRELIDQLIPLGTGAVWLAAAAIMGLATLGAFTAFFIIVLTLVFQPWLAALIVTCLWGFAAAGLLSAGLVKIKSATPIEFDETTRSVKEDVEWIKSGMKQNK